MPTRPDKGHTQKQGTGSRGGQKAVDGSARSPEVAEAAAEARTKDPQEREDER